MHETAIVAALIDQVEEQVRQSGLQGPVLRVEISIGRLSGVCPHSVRFAFEFLAAGTVVEGATLAIDEPRACCRCLACGAETVIDEIAVQCPRCGSDEVRIEGGRALMLQTIELAD